MGFFDGGGKSLSFGEVGSQHAAAMFKVWRGGIITDIGEARQGTDFKDRSKLLTWANGDPKIQLPITLNTASGKAPERPESAEDDLVRTLYITKGGAMYAGARAALRKAGANDFEVGGSLYICWTSGEGRTGDARQYELYYEAPVGNSGGFMNDATGQQPAAAPAMPPQTPPPGPQGGGFQPGAAPADPPAGQPGAPPPPVWNAQTQQWEVQQPEPAAPPAAPPPPPQPVWNAQTQQWEVQQPGQPSGPPPATPTQPAAPAANGWSPGQQSGPPSGGPQAAAQPAGNPFKR